MWLRFRAGGRTVACIARIHAGASVELADSANAFDNFFGTEATILVIPTISCSVGGKHGKLHQMDVLAHYIRRCTHLEVVLRVNTRNEIGYLECDAIVSVGAEEERLRRLCAIERWF